MNYKFTVLALALTTGLFACGKESPLNPNLRNPGNPQPLVETGSGQVLTPAPQPGANLPAAPKVLALDYDRNESFDPDKNPEILLTIPSGQVAEYEIQYCLEGLTEEEGCQTYFNVSCINQSSCESNNRPDVQIDALAVDEDTSVLSMTDTGSNNLVGLFLRARAYNGSASSDWLKK